MLEPNITRKNILGPIIFSEKFSENKKFSEKFFGAKNSSKENFYNLIKFHI